MRRLLTNRESDQVKRKESLRSGEANERTCPAICAYANDMPDPRSSGVIFDGAADRMGPAGNPPAEFTPDPSYVGVIVREAS